MSTKPLFIFQWSPPGIWQNSEQFWHSDCWHESINQFSYSEALGQLRVPPTRRRLHTDGSWMWSKTYQLKSPYNSKIRYSKNSIEFSVEFPEVTWSMFCTRHLHEVPHKHSLFKWFTVTGIGGETVRGNWWSLLSQNKGSFLHVHEPLREQSANFQWNPAVSVLIFLGRPRTSKLKASSDCCVASCL